MSESSNSTVGGFDFGSVPSALLPEFETCVSDKTGGLFKELGNKLTEKKKLKEAVMAYTYALEFDSSNHIYYSNRSAAYMHLLDAENSLNDANNCIRLCPDFTKGYCRKGTALLQLNHFQQCYEACLEGQKFGKGGQSDKSLSDLLRQCRKSFIAHLLIGKSFSGVVSDELGGYMQVFEFVSDSTMHIHAMGRTIDACYSLNVDQKPIWLNITTMIPGMEGYASPEVPYIMQFEIDALSLLKERAELSVSGPKKEKKSKKERRQDKERKLVNEMVINILNDSSENHLDLEEELNVKELHLCCPFMATERPKTFTGVGYCLMKSETSEEMERQKAIARGERCVREDLLTLTEDEQIEKFCVEMLELLPTQKPQEPSQDEDPQEAAKKYSIIVQLHNSMMALDLQYPETVSVAVQKYCDREIEVPAQHVKLIEQLRQRMDDLGFLQKQPTEEEMMEFVQQQQHKAELEKQKLHHAKSSTSIGDKQFQDALSKKNKKKDKVSISSGTSVPPFNNFLKKAQDFVSTPQGIVAISAAIAACTIGLYTLFKRN